MAIPVHLQQFKAAGIYRVVFDKSTILGVDTEILRLVVGYSEQGPFNIPTYITSPSDFKAIYGDVSKKLEKRGIFFHRLALQALQKAPILALNLKKFENESVDGATINTDFNPVFNTIDTVKLRVEDIYDTSRFWELSAEKLNNLKAVNGQILDQYINICTTNTTKTSGTYIIRKASGTNKLNGYNITINDWYADKIEEMPDYLIPYKNSLVSDFMAEIYVFKGRFTTSQVLASNTLKKYFEILRDSEGNPEKDENGKEILKLRDHLTNAFGDYVDTLDALYQDETSGAIGYYMGSLIPYFKNKRGGYIALDILFNSDQDVHNMMMSFNTDMLDEDGTAHIDISGRLSIPTDESKQLSLKKIFDGTASSTLLCNKDAKVVSSKIDYTVNILKEDVDGKLVTIIPFDNNNTRKATGTLFVSNIDDVNCKVTLSQVGNTSQTVTIDCGAGNLNDLWSVVLELGAAYKVSNAVAANDSSVKSFTNNKKQTVYVKLHESGHGTYWANGAAYLTDEGEFVLEGPVKVITSISRIEQIDANTKDYADADRNMKITIEDVICVEKEVSNPSIYDSSITFLPVSDNWNTDGVVESSLAFVCESIYDRTLFNSLQPGDCLLAMDGSTDRDGDDELDVTDNFYDNVYVQEVDTITDELGNITHYFVKLSGAPLLWEDEVSKISYLVRVDSAINQEIGTIVPQYLEGYTYENSKPEGTSMFDKLQWQKFILSTLTDYKGLRTGLLNKANIDYRYIIDTFETFVDESAKSVLTYLAKEKQSAFAILNFPAVKTFMKCPYTSFVDNNGIFNVEYVVKGYNKKKPAGIRFSLPSDEEGASFGAFYSPLKFSDGYVDSIVPSAGLVSNLFMEKYMSRQPYYIIAGPNYGGISASGLVGPDYKYSTEELHIIEPFGINCMVYRPGFGTFINANQTAKQTPVSALSKVNVRELVIYLQDEIEKVLQAYQWEFNNARTRQAILDKANAICSRIAANGGIQAYMNIMDESNNGPEIIDNEMAVLSTHIEPGMGCGKMVHELTLYRTGQMASAIAE